LASRVQREIVDIAQFYEQNIFDCDSGTSARMIMIPRDSFAPHVRSMLFDWHTLLGMTRIAILTTPAELVATFASLVGERSLAARELASEVLAWPLVLAGSRFEELVLPPLEQIMKSDAGEFSLVSMEGHLLLLCVLPEGLLIGSNPGTLADALDAGLSGKMREAMGLDGRSTRPGLVG
jgi:hypothetical protein